MVNAPARTRPHLVGCHGAAVTVGRPLLGTAATVAALLVAVACGGNSTAATPEGANPGAAAQDDIGTRAVASSDFLSTRPGIGIAAAGGNPTAVNDNNPCARPGAASDALAIAYVGADLADLNAIGIASVAVEDPGLIIEAYVNEVNFAGGLNGRCVELVTHPWSLADPVGGFAQVCAELPLQGPVFVFTLGLFKELVECLTIAAMIPTLGLRATTPESTFVRTTRWLFTDDGAIGRLLDRSLEAAIASGVISEHDRVGLLQGGGSSGMSTMALEELIRRAGLTHVVTSNVPTEYGSVELLLPEKQIRLLEAGLTEDGRGEAQRNFEALDPALAELLIQIEEFYLEAASSFKDAGVTVVAVVADWFDLRRMMRAAESIDWMPTWLANDMQSVTTALTDAPKRQAENLVQVSSRRAAGDQVPELDQGCITLRNTASEAPPFAHRPHTDAWNMITSVCDYLDVAFSALTRVDGPITSGTFVQAMNNTQYDTAYGGLITYSPSNRSGAERFRVLQADPDCLLNSWGCMRSTTNWLEPSSRVTS